MLSSNIENLIHDALKAGDTKKTSVLRLIKAAFLNYLKESSGNSLNETAEINILKKMAQHRVDAMNMYQSANRQDLFDNEKYEFDIISSFLPKAPSDADIKDILDEWVNDNGPVVKPKMGVVISYIKSKLPMADGKKVSEIVKNNIV